MEEPKKVEAPTPAESVAQSSVRVSNAVSVTPESISPERMAELISELEAKLPTTASKGLQFTMDEVLTGRSCRWWTRSPARCSVSARRGGRQGRPQHRVYAGYPVRRLVLDGAQTTS